MAEPKTRPTKSSVDSYLSAITDPVRRTDCETIIELMTEVTGFEPVMWEPGIVGFGSCHYKYASGHEGDSCLLGFASRKSDITVYLVSGFQGTEKLLSELGRHRTSKACLYIRRLSEIRMDVLKKLLIHSMTETRRLHP